MASVSASSITYTSEFIDACRNLWRDGFDKGVNGQDNYPDFSSFFSTVPATVSSTALTGKKFKEEPDYGAMEKLPFNSEKCEARVEKYGYAVQCTRSPFQSGCLCKTHQNILDNKLPEGASDLRYGRFNQPRPEKDSYKGEIIKWDGATRKTKQRKSKGVSNEDTKVKMKVGDMRDYLSSRVPIDDFRGLKKPDLTEFYMKVKEKENISSSEEENTPETNTSSRKEEKETLQDKKSEDNSIRGEQSIDEGMGVGLHLIPDTPKTITDYKRLFQELSIDTEGLKGIRAYKQAYQNHLRKEEEEEEKTKPMSDASDDSDDDDDDHLKEDQNSYDETSFEGVNYLEDEDSGKIYNLKHQHVGKWNEDTDDIIWVSDKFKHGHENARQ